MVNPSVAVVGALYADGLRGLGTDILAARALGLDPRPVCTSLVVAGGGRVTDVLDIPSDGVAAQLEHLFGQRPPSAMSIGVLADDVTATHVLDAAAEVDGPVVMNWVASGPSGETVLSARGIDAVAARLAVLDLVTLSRQDAELITGAEISSLDDAQVAAQRLHNRGARRVVVRCGTLPYRFYDAADDPGGATDGARKAFSFDLYYDGEDFALFEAPRIEGPTPDGAASAFVLAVIRARLDARPFEEALQAAKRFATESVRQSVEAESGLPVLNPHWGWANKT